MLENDCISKVRYLSRTIWKTLVNATAQTPSLYVDSYKNDQHFLPPTNIPNETRLNESATNETSTTSTNDPSLNTGTITVVLV